MSNENIALLRLPTDLRDRYQAAARAERRRTGDELQWTDLARADLAAAVGRREKRVKRETSKKRRMNHD